MRQFKLNEQAATSEYARIYDVTLVENNIETKLDTLRLSDAINDCSIEIISEAVHNAIDATLFVLNLPALTDSEYNRIVENHDWLITTTDDVSDLQRLSGFAVEKKIIQYDDINHTLTEVEVK